MKEANHYANAASRTGMLDDEQLDGFIPCTKCAININISLPWQHLSVWHRWMIKYRLQLNLCLKTVQFIKTLCDGDIVDRDIMI